MDFIINKLAQMKIFIKKPFLAYIIAGMTVFLTSFYISGIKQEETETIFKFKKLKYTRLLKYQKILMEDEDGTSKSYSRPISILSAIKKEPEVFICYKISETGYRYLKSQDYSYRGGLISIEENIKCQ
jgi:hypothetical protein